MPSNTSLALPCTVSVSDLAEELIAATLKIQVADQNGVALTGSKQIVTSTTATDSSYSHECVVP